jgi:limonene 1,2-monooxygenase
MTSRLRFGLFLGPFHPAGVNPTLALRSDLRLIQHLDALGYDEAWFGEHHSAGTEIIGSPELFIAAAGERTERIKLGTGVIVLPYHNPLWVAERMVMLDHLTRGRVMFGAGPGGLPTDGVMLGLEPAQTRALFEVALDTVMRLLTSDEPVTAESEGWRLRDARLHLRPYSDPLFDTVVTTISTPTGPRLAGRHGMGLLCVGATTAAGFDSLGPSWEVLQEESTRHGFRPDRGQWRLVGPMHCAPTREQALREVEYGIADYFHYFQKVSPFPLEMKGSNPREMAAFVNESGFGVIGTPDDCAEQIERLVAQSQGGFGAYLLLGHNWAAPAATFASYELFARSVMPRFQGQAAPTIDAARRAAARRTELGAAAQSAREAARVRYASSPERKAS